MFHGQKALEADWYSLSLSGPDMELSEHFKLNEFACRDGTDAVCVHPVLVDLLEELRVYYLGKPIHVISAYRTPKHNRVIGGASRSRHMYGMAADIIIKGVSPGSVASTADDLGAGGVGDYDSFTHVDVQGEGRRWHG